MNTYYYSIIRLTPNSVRSESVNVGIAIQTPSGADVRVITSMAKINAITNDYKIDELQKLKTQIEDFMLNGIKLPQLASFYHGAINLSSVGMFSVASVDEYESKINEINKLYITPEKSTKMTSVGQKRIITELKNHFHKYGILGKDISDIKNHKVVTKYPLSEDEGLYAELLLKNGAYHLTETLDFRSDNIKQKLGDTALKAVTMDKARAIWDKEVNTFLVYAAESKHEKNHSTQLTLIDNYADRMFNLLSGDDMADYFDHMLNAAGCNMASH
ncbi:DUF3037 domain-containing protein [Providencia rettgeri]|uniref:DUF3037 domain-containing protein n=1 Tax=Providencia rettgeri TaxID=587 RepID=UPI002360FB47|nr:DUF3037 domain-containing protein [Providencia rettgeri]